MYNITKEEEQMADIEEVNRVSGVFGGVELGSIGNEAQQNQANQQNQQNAGTIRQAGGNNLPAKIGFWGRIKAFWLQKIDWNQEIKVELTPTQQKIEDEINDFLYQDVTFGKVHDFLFQKITFGNKN